jgi:pimeloyl-ACP methyl ester carboxylesterase
MRYDTTLIRGDVGNPAIVFVHGLGMDKHIWDSPDESRILGGRFPVGLLVREEPKSEADVDEHSVTKRLSFGRHQKHLTTLFHDLKKQGFPLLAWSQQRPSAEIAIAVSELRDLLATHKDYCRQGIILVGHSRGGLVARKYVASGDERVRGLLTLATPHRGSRMAQWVGYLSPLASLLNPLLSETEKGTLLYTVKRIAEFLSSKAVKELLPDSLFFKSLEDGEVDGVYYCSVGGNDPTLFSLYMTVMGKVQDSGRRRTVVKSKEIFSVPEVFEKLLPEKLFPEEMKKGRGDGLVSLESSMLPWAHQRHAFAVNHAEILFDEEVRARAKDFVNWIVRQ